VALSLAVSAGFTYLALRGVRLGDVWRGLRESNYWWIVPSVALLLIALCLRALRWQYLFVAATRPPYRPVLDATILGQFFNNVLPARAGEAARVIALNQTAGTSRAETAATVVVERVYDLLVLLVVLFVLLPWLPHLTWLRAAVILATMLFVATAAVAVALARFGDKPFRALLRPLTRLPFVSHERTERAAAGLLRGAASIRDPRLAFVALVLTSASWVLLALSSWVLMLGFHLGLSPLAGALISIAIGLSLVIPSSPAAIGVFETAALVVLQAYGIVKSDALSYALVLHAVNFLPYVMLGAWVLHTHAQALRGRRLVPRL
jgi:glycosyltransferase 2 family protein